MDILSDDFIMQLANAANIRLHGSSVKYIKLLLEPFVNTDQILMLVSARFPRKNSSELSQIINYNAGAMLLTDRMTRNNHIQDVSVQTLQTIKMTIIEYMIILILGVLRRSPMSNIETVFPWDVKSAMSEDEALSKIMEIQFVNTFEVVLPVNLVVGAQQFTLNVTLEFVFGLLLFSFISRIDFNITMYGVKFFPDYMAPDNITRFTNFKRGPRTLTNYTIEISGGTYGFESLNFIEGFISGALWTGVDHHLYWKNLRDYSLDDMNGKEITF